MERKKIFWLTGLPCSGKTTIANKLSKLIDAEILDGDTIRDSLDFKDFSQEGRKFHMLEVARRAYNLSKDKNVIVALVSPIKSVREEIKKKYPNVIEIWIQCDVKECMRRDVKGMYKLAKDGKLKDFTGVDSIYEEPNTQGPNKTTFVDTEILEVDQCVEIIMERHYAE